MAETDIQGMLVRIEATTAQLRSEIARADSSVAQGAVKIESSLAQIDEGFDRVGASAKSAGDLIRGAMGVAAGAISVKSIIDAADSYSQMSDRIGLATGSFGEYNLVQERLLETAKRTYRPLSEAQELFIGTSDSLKSMGYNTSQALDVMDSFSFLLVTNSASADKATSAIDAYSKSLQTGKVDVDSWQSIQAAMPTIVDALAKATGKSSEEIRSLGSQGKLSLDVLTEGLQKSVEANGELADSMGVAVRDSLQNLSNAFSVYVGQANEAHDFTGKLAGGISLLGDNFGYLADIALAAATGALAKYSSTAIGAGYSALKDAAARKAQAAAVLLVAQAEQQKAQTTVFLAEKEAIAVRGTAVQTQMSLQLAEARMAEARATAAAGAAQEAVNKASFSLVGMLGGPTGIIALAIGAATAFLTLRDNTSELEKRLGDLADPVEKLTERFGELNRATQSVTLRELTSKVEKMQGQLRQMSGAIADQFEADLRNMGAAGADGLMAGLIPLPGDAQKALDLVRQAAKDQADGIKVDWKSVADQLRSLPGVTEAMAQAIEESQGPVTDFSAELEHQRQILAALTGQTDEHTAAMGRNAAQAAASAQETQKYLDQQLKQLASAQDKTFTDAANRYIAERADLSEGEKAAILSVAAARDAQKRADDEATQSRRKGSSEAEQSAKKQLKDFESTEEGYKRQIQLINTTGDKQKDATEVAKLSFELQEGKLGNLSQAQQKHLLGLAAELDSLNKIKKANENALKLSAFKAAQATGTQTAINGYDQELAGIGRGDKARDRMRADLALRQKYVEDLNDLNEQRNTGQISPELYQQETQVLTDELNKRLVAQQNYFQRVDEAQSNWSIGATSALENYLDSAADVAGQTQDLFTNAFSNLEDGIVQFIKTGKASFKDFADSIIEDLIRIQVRQAAAGFLGSAFNFLGGGSSALGQGTMTGFSEVIPNAKGGVYDSPSLSSFSNQVHDSPQMFAFAKGAGIFAEAGPEAIMPLARGPDGSLGVVSMGAGGSSGDQAPITLGNITQHFHFSGGTDGVTKEDLERSTRKGIEGAYQTMLRDFKTNGPGRQLLSKK
ncbi:phage tail tape measure protein [Pseudomonas monteilii]|uniref:phage tail tape measure protein n=2 Tax=Pseudomonas monteilii TaxID=76759 RepID=UPI001E39491B|nr:phage tail tape measure protein [Pseudomonas monteilii]MCE0933387.1 phage tail tape measure protein [Pseudomonas monteilii]WJR40792.1 phage tail tape measure protein [Pseudomonas monteilii]